MPRIMEFLIFESLKQRQIAFDTFQELICKFGVQKFGWGTRGGRSVHLCCRWLCQLVVIIDDNRIGLLGEHGLANGVLGEHVAWHHAEGVELIVRDGRPVGDRIQLCIPVKTVINEDQK